MLPHIYVKKLKNILKKMKGGKKMINNIGKIYVELDKETFMPLSVELHYNSKELEDEYSMKGSMLLHRMHNFPKIALKILRYNEDINEYIPLQNIDTLKGIALVYDNWKSQWHINEIEKA